MPDARLQKTRAAYQKPAQRPSLTIDRNAAFLRTALDSYFEEARIERQNLLKVHEIEMRQRADHTVRNFIE